MEQNQSMAQPELKNELQILGGDDKGKVTYKVNGQEVTLSVNIVKRFLTQGNKDIPDADVIQFIAICKFNELNPFLKEAYLVKFGSQPAQMITSKEAFFKRAESSEHYEGFRGGIIVKRDNAILDLEGCFYLPNDVLLGGWCEVYRDDRKYPIIARVRLQDYDKRQSIWNEKKATMICKVAKAQAMREAFPANLGAMYTPEETQPEIDDQSESVEKEIGQNANTVPIGFESGKEVVVEPAINTTEVQASEPKKVADVPMGEMENPDWF